ncbi:MAG: hypothetical protein H0U22_17125, partial [Geodermatophilaceae bacterium]|nr:hypothetical protein [Geodermatophilaceae bacterium]
MTVASGGPPTTYRPYTTPRDSTAAIAAPGLVWATGLARPPFVCTCSVWESARMAAAYAYGSADRGHPDAIDADAAKPFHKQSAFVRFRPYHVEGLLSGPN